MHRPSTKHKSRISTDPRIKSRLRDFEFLDKIHQRVKRHKTTQIFSPGRLANYPIAHGSFDIDQDDPIDLEPRFFLPGLVEDMESALKTQPLAWSDTIESFPPIEQHHTTQGSDPWLVRLAALRATGDAYTLEHQFFCTSSEIKKWSDDWYGHVSEATELYKTNLLTVVIPGISQATTDLAAMPGGPNPMDASAATHSDRAIF